MLGESHLGHLTPCSGAGLVVLRPSVTSWSLGVGGGMPSGGTIEGRERKKKDRYVCSYIERKRERERLSFN